ncbi:signal peptidase I [Paracoccus sp. 1_MG-2023]|uniref:signal peptidase I n=1 Tax=unclassified Paracoccus (in: a-proteobacteria) TaxID=2688777 RepID=UPI001C08B39C|nr:MULTISPECIES: signal peptidase I [unclassified Paracoccus (in: a-proteobacteria)]MBU2956978.1 signal peptidase I [Paracoccus sp. C2R09]MDO6668175.1 signal peptidase I [Paracoccus sp. 1_MG-2023]
MAESAAPKKKDGIWETIKTIFWALVIAGIFRTLFFQPFWIPSGSMKDTLLIGDFLFVNKMAYGYSAHSCPFSACPISGRILGSEPERGDVVVFRHPVRNVDFIKRVIGLPGDTVQMRGGRLFLNGEEVPTTPAGDFVETKEQQGPQGLIPRCANEPVAAGGDCIKPRTTENLPGGHSHDVLNITDGWVADDTPTYTVPQGHYFFMGDNRDNSEDSRFPPEIGGLGFVPDEYLIGRADRIMFSSAGRSLLYFWTWRPDRFFKAVN